MDYSHHQRCFKHCLLAICCCLVACTLAVEGETLGMLITGESGEYLFSFPESEDYIMFKFGGNNAGFSVLTATRLYEDILDVFSQGLFAGRQTTGVGLLDREMWFDSAAGFQEQFVAGETLATFSFSTSGGVASAHFEIADEKQDDDYAYVQLSLGTVTGEMWVEVLNGVLVSPMIDEPKLKLIGYDTPAGGGGAAGQTLQQIQITIQNVSDMPFVGPIECEIGLSYAMNWIPEWDTVFSRPDFGQILLAPGGISTLNVDVPPVPVSAIEVLRKRSGFWTGYVDPDPEQDYIGVHLCMNGQHWCVFLPFTDHTQTVATRKPCQ